MTKRSSMSKRSKETADRVELTELLNGDHREIKINHSHQIEEGAALMDLVYFVKGEITNIPNGINPNGAIGYISQIPTEDNGNTLGIVLFGQEDRI